MWHYILLEFLNGDTLFLGKVDLPWRGDTLMLEGYKFSKKESKPGRKVRFRQAIGPQLKDEYLQVESY